MAKHDEIDVSGAFKAFSLLITELDDGELKVEFGDVARNAQEALEGFFADNREAVIAQRLLAVAEKMAKRSGRTITVLREELKQAQAERTGQYDDPALTSAKFHEKREQMFADVKVMMERFATAKKRGKPSEETQTTGDFLNEGKAAALELGFARLTRYTVEGYGTLGVLAYGPYVYVFSKWPQGFFGAPKWGIDDFKAFVSQGSGKLQPRNDAEEGNSRNITLNIPAIYTKDGYGNRKLHVKPDFAFKGYDYAHVLIYIAGVLPIDASIVLGRTGSGESKPGAVRPA